MKRVVSIVLSVMLIAISAVALGSTQNAQAAKAKKAKNVYYVAVCKSGKIWIDHNPKHKSPYTGFCSRQKGIKKKVGYYSSLSKAKSQGKKVAKQLGFKKFSYTIK